MIHRPDDEETGQQPSTNEQVVVSIVMPVRNEGAHIGNTLRQVLKQDSGGHPVEVLVADGQSTDQTRDVVNEIAQHDPRVRVFDNPRHLSSAARNIGIRNSRGNYIVIIDGHCELRGDSYFADLVDAFDRTGADCLGRPQPLDVTDASPLQLAIAAARNSPLGHHPDSFIYSSSEIQVPAISVAAAYRSDVFEQVGMFDEQFDACEDCELNHRIDKAGLSCFLIPSLAVHYQPRTSLSGLFRQLARYGRGRIRLAKKHPDSLSLSTLLPGLFLAFLMLGPVLGFLLPTFAYAWLLVMLAYVILVAGVSIQAAMSSSRPSILFRLPWVFLVVHIASGWGVWRELFSFSGRTHNP